MTEFKCFAISKAGEWYTSLMLKKNLAFQEVVKLKNRTEVCAGDYSTQGAKGRVKTEPGC